MVHPLREHDHQQDRDGDDRGGGVHGAELAGDGADRADRGRPAAEHTEHGGELVHHDLHGDPRENTCHRGVERNSEIHPIRSRANRRD